MLIDLFLRSLIIKKHFNLPFMFNFLMFCVLDIFTRTSQLLLTQLIPIE